MLWELRVSKALYEFLTSSGGWEDQGPWGAVFTFCLTPPRHTLLPPRGEALASPVLPQIQRADAFPKTTSRLARWPLIFFLGVTPSLRQTDPISLRDAQLQGSAFLGREKNIYFYFYWLKFSISFNYKYRWPTTVLHVVEIHVIFSHHGTKISKYHLCSSFEIMELIHLMLILLFNVLIKKPIHCHVTNVPFFMLWWLYFNIFDSPCMKCLYWKVLFWERGHRLPTTLWVLSLHVEGFPEVAGSSYLWVGEPGEVGV